MKKLIGLLILVLSSALLVVSCGGSGDGDTYGNSNIGWLSIESSSVILNNEGESYADVNGTAFVSPDYTANKHSGLCILLCTYDDSYPGVDVSWENKTNSTNGTATSRYGTATKWDHIWHASIPLIPGNNDIVITASDPGGNHGSDSVTVECLPPTPQNLSADSSDGQITLIWGNISGAESYNIYWSTEAGVTEVTGTKITNVTSPYAHSGLINGVTYYYAITSVVTGIESGLSNEISAVPGSPERPNSVMAEASNGDIIISWADVSTATSYNIYWANNPNVTKDTGNLISGVTSPYVHIGLTGIPYYYVVTAVNNYGESLESLEITAMPQLPPPAPTGIHATARYDQNYSVIDVAWDNVPKVNYYNLFRCNAGWIISVDPPEVSMCMMGWEQIYTGADALYTDLNVTPDGAYRYRVTAVNDFGESNPSEDIGISAVEY